MRSSFLPVRLQECVQELQHIDADSVIETPEWGRDLAEEFIDAPYVAAMCLLKWLYAVLSLDEPG